MGFYLLLALTFTWPLAWHFLEAIPGDGRDGWQMVWNLWWVRYALEHGQNPFRTNLIFYPTGANLYLHALNALNGFISLPIQYLAGNAIPAYNFIVIFALASSGYGAFCLARFLWVDFAGAVFAGMAFGFSSYHFAHLLGHLNLISSEFIPFYILFFLKALHTQGKWLRQAFLAILTLGAGMLLELQYIFYLAIFSTLYLIYLSIVWLIEKRFPGKSPRINLKKIWLRALFVAGIFLFITLPLTLPMFNEAQNNPNTVPNREDAIYSADFLAYFYPSPFEPLWSGPLKQAIKPWTATLIEKVVFPGYSVYLLGLLGFFLWLLSSKKPLESLETGGGEIRKPGALFWLAVALVFIILSWGRRLHINGVELGPPLPAALIYKLPILNISQAPCR